MSTQVVRFSVIPGLIGNPGSKNPKSEYRNSKQIKKIQMVQIQIVFNF